MQALSADSKEFLIALHERFNTTREKLLRARTERQAKLIAGERPGFPVETSELRTIPWGVGTIPRDLQDRRVEITGPAERKMMINALNSGANVFMADFEDALSPTWRNIIQGQEALLEAVRRELSYSAGDGKVYSLNPTTATLVVRPRGWHLVERHFEVNGTSISASLFDFGLYFFNNVKELMQRRSGPYFYLPKLENRLEARLWNDVFLFAQDYMRIPSGTIKATVLIETILAAFEMDEILFELKDHIVGLNAGRWDYIFSAIKKFAPAGAPVFPDRSQITMAVPFMRAYSKLLVQTCHRRGAHAIGGMSAFIPNRKDPEVTARALAKVREDKEREARDGFDGTWVAHPDLVPVAREIFDRYLGNRPNQKEGTSPLSFIDDFELTDFSIPEGAVTEEGVRSNVRICIQYLAHWLEGRGAVAIQNLMEDAATAEISRAQLWQWISRGAKLRDGRLVTSDLYRTVRDEELSHLSDILAPSSLPLQSAVELLDQLVLNEGFSEFLTVPAYEKLKSH